MHIHAKSCRYVSQPFCGVIKLVALYSVRRELLGVRYKLLYAERRFHRQRNGLFPQLVCLCLVLQKYLQGLVLQLKLTAYLHQVNCIVLDLVDTEKHQHTLCKICSHLRKAALLPIGVFKAHAKRAQLAFLPLYLRVELLQVGLPPLLRAVEVFHCILQVLVRRDSLVDCHRTLALLQKVIHACGAYCRRHHLVCLCHSLYLVYRLLYGYLLLFLAGNRLHRGGLFLLGKNFERIYTLTILLPQCPRSLIFRVFKLLYLIELLLRIKPPLRRAYLLYLLSTQLRHHRQQLVYRVSILRCRGGNVRIKVYFDIA